MKQAGRVSRRHDVRRERFEGCRCLLAEGLGGLWIEPGIKSGGSAAAEIGREGEQLQPGDPRQERDRGHSKSLGVRPRTRFVIGDPDWEGLENAPRFETTEVLEQVAHIILRGTRNACAETGSTAGSGGQKTRTDSFRTLKEPGQPALGTGVRTLMMLQSPAAARVEDFDHIDAFAPENLEGRGSKLGPKNGLQTALENGNLRPGPRR